MDMNQAAAWLAGSILTMLGLIVVVAGMIAINNMLSKYWKPVQFFKWPPETPPTRFMTQEEYSKIAPKLDPEHKHEY